MAMAAENEMGFRHDARKRGVAELGWEMREGQGAAAGASRLAGWPARC